MYSDSTIINPSTVQLRIPFPVLSILKKRLIASSAVIPPPYITYPLISVLVLSRTSDPSPSIHSAVPAVARFPCSVVSVHRRYPFSRRHPFFRRSPEVQLPSEFRYPPSRLRTSSRTYFLASLHLLPNPPPPRHSRSYTEQPPSPYPLLALSKRFASLQRI